MISMLKNWSGAVEVNEESFDSVTTLISSNKTFSGPIHIKLYPKSFSFNGEQTRQHRNDSNESANLQTYRITVKAYMTKQSEGGFDFMLKWNNDNPMPLRTMVGTIEKETKGMYKMKLKGKAEATCTCLRCGRELKNPVSRYYGIGPECMSKLGMIRLDIEDIEGITQRLEEVEWEGWVIKSAITSMEEVA
jgi:hypothetical protein